MMDIYIASFFSILLVKLYKHFACILWFVLIWGSTYLGVELSKDIKESTGYMLCDTVILRKLVTGFHDCISDGCDKIADFNC